jgi:hypothetical protein
MSKRILTLVLAYNTNISVSLILDLYSHNQNRAEPNTDLSNNIGVHFRFAS